MDEKSLKKLCREAKRQRAMEGYPAMDIKKLIAIMTPEQRKQFWDMLNGKNKEGMTIEI